MIKIPGVGSILTLIKLLDPPSSSVPCLASWAGFWTGYSVVIGHALLPFGKATGQETISKGALDTVFYYLYSYSKKTKWLATMVLKYYYVYCIMCTVLCTKYMGLPFGLQANIRCHTLPDIIQHWILGLTKQS